LWSDEPGCSTNAISQSGLAAHGVHEFNEVGWIPSLVEHVWDINHILDEKSSIGELLKALFGYNGNPSLSEVIAYVGYLGAVLIGLRWRNSRTTVPSEICVGSESPRI
jgi:high-affinity iron transporter